MRALNKGASSESRTDWHPARILYELRLKGWTLRSLSFHCGYGSNVLQNALRKPYPKAERILAKALSVSPETIWPSRYAARRARARKSS